MRQRECLHSMHDDHVYVATPQFLPLPLPLLTTLPQTERAVDVTNGAHVQVESRHLLVVRLRPSLDLVWMQPRHWHW